MFYEIAVHDDGDTEVRTVLPAQALAGTLGTSLVLQGRESARVELLSYGATPQAADAALDAVDANFYEWVPV